VKEMPCTATRLMRRPIGAERSGRNGTRRSEFF
jgi:hypothetical protein